MDAIGYIWKYEDLVESLETDLKYLVAGLSTINTDVDYYKQQRVINEDVTSWIQTANELLIVAKEFLETTEKNATGCCGNGCNWKTRYSDAKKAENHAEEIEKLMAEGKQFDSVYFRHLDPEPMAEFWASGYVALPSMDETIEQLKRFLRLGGSDEKLVVGIFGVEGVGKTRIAMKFAADMESDGVKVVVANGKDDIKSIQSQIAERVGFEFTAESVTERASSLCKTLIKMKVLIILDNVDKRINLIDIGVPQPATDNGCRILVVSTTSEACEAMDSQKNLEIKPLTREESSTFAAGLAIYYEWSEYSLADLSYEKAGLPGEIERCIVNQTTPSTKLFASAPTGAWISMSPSTGAWISTFFIDADALEIAHKDRPAYWTLDRSKSSPEAVLNLVWYLNIEGKTKGLGFFPETNYGAYFVYQLSDNAKGFNINPLEMIVGNKSKLFYLDPSKSSNEKPTKRADKWLEIEMGRFYSDDYADSPVDLIVKDNDTSIAKSGLRIHGIELRQIVASPSTRAWINKSPSTGDGMSTFFLDAEALEIAHMDTPAYWRLDRSKSSPEAVLNLVWFLNIEGKTKGLGFSPKTNYGAYFVYQLSYNAEGFNTNPVEMIVGRNSKLCYLDPSKSSNERPIERVDKWLEIEMGRFYSDDYAYSPLELIVKNNDPSVVKSGLRIHGIELRQINVSPSTGVGMITSPLSGAGINTSPSTGRGITTSPSTREGLSTFFLDVDAIEIAHKDTPAYWRLDRSKSSLEAMLIQVWFINIEWKAMGLFPGINYGAYFVYQLSDNAKGFNINPLEMIVGKNSKLCYLDPSKSSNDIPTERTDKWLEIEMGIFNSDDYAYSPVDLVVRDHDASIVKSGLRVHGIELRQLTVSPSSGGGASTILLDADAIQIAHKDNPLHWRLDLSNSSPEAELIQVCYLNINGKAISMFPGTNYGAYFVYQLSDNANGFNINPVEMIVGKNSKLFYLDPPKFSNEKPTRRDDKWLEIEMGRFYSDDYAYSPVNLVIKDHDISSVKSGLRIHHIELRQLDQT